MSVRNILAAAVACALVAAVGPDASAATLECGLIGTRYDSLFIDGNKRVSDLTAAFKALPVTPPKARGSPFATASARPPAR